MANERKELRFTFDSAQCELLLAFEQASSLQHLAKLLARDVSVASRQLQRVADVAPVLEKKAGRWVLTALGRQLNQWTRAALQSQNRLLRQQRELRLNPHAPSVENTRAALVLVGVQQGFAHPSWGARNNLEAEEEIKKLLKEWRRKEREVFHVHHISTEPLSPVKKGMQGALPLPFAKPTAHEAVVLKSTNSGFSGTQLEAALRRVGVDVLVVVGFSLNHCVDATVRDAADRGFGVFLPGDAVVSFERSAPDGSLLSAESVHQVALANLNQEFCTVVRAADLFQNDEEECT